MVELARRMNNLGTETAFAVSAEANSFAAEGNKVYPFHLGDLNIKTPTNVVEAAEKAIASGKTGYCSNYGIPELRKAVAENVSKSHGIDYTMENVAIQPGGKPVVAKFLLALMNPGDEVLYPNPGYPIYESQIEFNGGVAVPYTFEEAENGFQLDIKTFEKLVTPKTRLLIFNNLQNPTGAESSHDELEKVAKIACKNNLVVLCDEAYFDIRYEGKSESLASFPGMKERSVILYTFSKKFAMTGWRLGAAIGPKEVIDAIAKLNVNIESCPNHFIQYGAVEGLKGNQDECRKILAVLKERRDVAVEILNTIKGVNCHRPHATFYLYPNVTGLMERIGCKDYTEFRINVLKNTGVSFCTRMHFGKPLPGEKEKYIRLAYSGIDTGDIVEGLTKLKNFVK